MREKFIRLYSKYLELTQKQSSYIEDGKLEELQQCMKEREQLQDRISAAEEASSLSPEEREEAKSILAEAAEINKENMNLLAKLKEALSKRLDELGQAERQNKAYTKLPQQEAKFLDKKQ